MRSEACDVVEAFAIWTAVIVNDRLSEVVAVPERRAGNSGYSCVYRIEARSQIFRPIESSGFGCEFCLQNLIQLSGPLVFLDRIVRKLILRFFEQACAFHPRPWAHPRVFAMDVPHRR